MIDRQHCCGKSWESSSRLIVSNAYNCALALQAFHQASKAVTSVEVASLVIPLWLGDIDTKLYTPTRDGIPQMIHKQGAIVNMSSGTDITGIPQNPIYDTSKHAVL